MVNAQLLARLHRIYVESISTYLCCIYKPCRATEPAVFRKSHRPKSALHMAHKAAIQVFQTTRGGGSLEANGSEPVNTFNFNDFLERNVTQGYWKPRFAAWPRGGYTRKEAMQRSTTGKLEVTPGSYEWKARFDSRGNMLANAPERLAKLHASPRAPSESSNLGLCTNVTARFLDPEAPILDKEATFKADLGNRLTKWLKTHYPNRCSNEQAPHLQDSRSMTPLSSHRGVTSTASSESWEVLSSASADLENYHQPAGLRFAKPTPGHLLSKVPVLPAPFFPDVGKHQRLLAASRVPVVKSDGAGVPLKRVAHLRPYAQPWKIYFDHCT
jgi:hypothetical protein